MLYPNGLRFCKLQFPRKYNCFQICFCNLFSNLLFHLHLLLSKHRMFDYENYIYCKFSDLLFYKPQIRYFNIFEFAVFIVILNAIFLLFLVEHLLQSQQLICLHNRLKVLLHANDCYFLQSNQHDNPMEL